MFGGILAICPGEMSSGKSRRRERVHGKRSRRHEKRFVSRRHTTDRGKQSSSKGHETTEDIVFSRTGKGIFPFPRRYGPPFNDFTLTPYSTRRKVKSKWNLSFSVRFHDFIPTPPIHVVLSLHFIVIRQQVRLADRAARLSGQTTFLTTRDTKTAAGLADRNTQKTA